MILTVENQNITVNETPEYVEGTRNEYDCEFVFDGSWNDYNKMCVCIFNNGPAVETPLDNENKCVIPIIKDAGLMKIGVYGVSEDKVKPTVWSEPIWVKPGTTVEGNKTPPEMGYLQQLQALIGDLSKLDDTNIVDALIGFAGEEIEASATTLEPGENATVENIGEGRHTVLVFGIPKGRDGEPGKPGDPGEPGQPGEPGHTPERGVDYWTAEDIATIQAYIDTQLGVIENGTY